MIGVDHNGVTVDDPRIFERLLTTATAIGTRVTGDAYERFRITPTGVMEWGPGNGTFDANIYRVGVGAFKSDDSFDIVGVIRGFTAIETRDTGDATKGLIVTSPGATAQPVATGIIEGWASGFGTRKWYILGEQSNYIHFGMEGGATHLALTGGNLVQDAGTYHNFGGTNGTGGYGFRANAGAMEYKDNAGTWIPFNSLTGGGGGGVGGAGTIGTIAKWTTASAVGNSIMTESGAEIAIAGSVKLSASAYINIGATSGSGGYGLRDNAGAIEYKDSGGAWTPFASAVASGWTPSAGKVVLTTVTDQVAIGTATPVGASDLTVAALLTVSAGGATITGASSITHAGTPLTVNNTVIAGTAYNVMLMAQSDTAKESITLAYHTTTGVVDRIHLWGGATGNTIDFHIGSKAVPSAIAITYGTGAVAFAAAITSAANITVSAGGITVTGASTITGTLSGITTLTATSFVGAVSTAAQTAITSLGTLTALTISGLLTMTAAASQIRPGATSFAIRDTGNTNNNLIILDSGAATLRNTLTLTAGNIVQATGTYHNFDAVSGTTGVGFWNDAGVMKFRDSGGGWTSFISLATGMAGGVWTRDPGTGNVWTTTYTDKVVIGSNTPIGSAPLTVIGNVVISTGTLTVGNGGAQITGNSQVSGTMLVTGLITGQSGLAITGAATISTDLTVDTNTFFVDATNNRVGILTTSPAFPLDVQGGTASPARFQQDRPTNTVGTIIALDATNSAAVGGNGLGVGIIMRAESSTTAAQNQAYIVSYWTDATHATMTSTWAVQTVTAGAALTEGIRLSAGVLTVATSVNVTLDNGYSIGSTQALNATGSILSVGFGGWGDTRLYSTTMVNMYVNAVNTFRSTNALITLSVPVTTSSSVSVGTGLGVGGAATIGSTLTVSSGGAGITGNTTVTGILTATGTINSGVTGSGTGGNMRFTDDGNGGAGVSRWLVGLLGTAGATAFSIYNIVDGIVRLSIATSTGLVTIASGLTVSAGGITGTLLTASQANVTTMAGLVSVSTITTGTWQATAIGAAYGGTGLTSYTQGDMLYASAATTFARVGKDTNATRYLSNTGASNNPAWAQVNLNNGVTGTLPVASGGSGQSGFTNGQLLIGNTTSGGLDKATLTGTANQVIVTNGVGSITLSLPQSIHSGATVTFAQGNITDVIATNLTGAIQTPNQPLITGLGTVTSGTWSAATIAVDRGGTGFSAYAQGDMLYASGATTLAKVGKDTNATRYLSNTGASNNPAWAQVNLNNGVTGTLQPGSGGTGQSTYTNGQLLIGNTTGSTLAKATLTGTTNQVIVTNGAGSITLSLPQAIHSTASVVFTQINVDHVVATDLVGQLLTPVQSLITTVGTLTNTIIDGTLGVTGVISVGKATSTFGGNIQFKLDTGTARYTVGVMNTAAATAFSIYDIVGAAARVTINTSGNMGFNTADIEAWSTNYQAIHLGSTGAMLYGSTAVYLGENFQFIEAGAVDVWQYRAAGNASLIGMVGGQTTFYTSLISGVAAGDALTWVAALRVNTNNGTLTVYNGMTVAAGGITVTAGGATINAGGLTLGASGGNISVNGVGASVNADAGNFDAVVATNLTGTITSASAVQPNITTMAALTSIGTLTALTVSGDVTLTNATVTIKVGGSTTQVAIRNAANTFNNLLILDSGATTLRNTLTVSAGGLVVTGAATFSSSITMGGSLNVQMDAPSGTATARVENTSITTGVNSALFLVMTEGAAGPTGSTGDPFIRFISRNNAGGTAGSGGETNYVMGIDYSDSQALIIGVGTGLGSANAIRISAVNAMTISSSVTFTNAVGMNSGLTVSGGSGITGTLATVSQPNVTTMAALTNIGTLVDLAVNGGSTFTGGSVSMTYAGTALTVENTLLTLSTYHAALIVRHSSTLSSVTMGHHTDGTGIDYSYIYGSNGTTQKPFHVGTAATPSAIQIAYANGLITTANYVGIKVAPLAALQAGAAYSLTLNANSTIDFAGGDTGIFHNAYMLATSAYRWVTTHMSGFGSRGIRFSYTDGITFYADSVNTTANTGFTPTQRFNISNAGVATFAGNVGGITTLTAATVNATSAYQVNGTQIMSEAGSAFIMGSNSYNEFRYNALQRHMYYINSAERLRVDNTLVQTFVPLTAAGLLTVTTGGAAITGITTIASGNVYNHAGGILRMSSSGGETIAVHGVGISRYEGNTDDMQLWLNWVGYQGGTTKYRDLVIGDGRGNIVGFVDGSAGRMGIGVGGTVGAALDVQGSGAASILGVKQAGSIAATAIDVSMFSESGYTMGVRKGAETKSRWLLWANGRQDWGIGGSTDVDVSLQRPSGVGTVLNNGAGQLVISSARGGYWFLTTTTDITPSGTAYVLMPAGTITVGLSITLIGNPVGLAAGTSIGLSGSVGIYTSGIHTWTLRVTAGGALELVSANTPATITKLVAHILYT